DVDAAAPSGTGPARARDAAAAHPVRRTIPAELPPRVGHFTGRAAQMSTLDDLLPAGPSVDQTAVALLCGPAGMGKTALAVQWAHGVADRSPDGQVFAALRGHDPATAMDACEAVGHVLRALGVPADRVPTEAAAQAHLYRSLVHERRLLIVCDNAGSAEQ